MHFFNQFVEFGCLAGLLVVLHNAVVYIPILSCVARETVNTVVVLKILPQASTNNTTIMDIADIDEEGIASNRADRIMPTIDESSAAQGAVMINVRAFTFRYHYNLPE